MRVFQKKSNVATKLHIKLKSLYDLGVRNGKITPEVGSEVSIDLDRDIYLITIPGELVDHLLDSEVFRDKYEKAAKKQRSSALEPAVDVDIASSTSSHGLPPKPNKHELS
jgi:hypothetical protein